MARQTEPKIKLMRKVGTDIGLKSNTMKVARRIGILPGFHGRRGRRKVSDYGQQLLEKQKVRIMYGVVEKQMRRYYEKAVASSEATGVVLLMALEQRLDNVLYRLGLTPTRAAARQLINHGNVLVNNQKLSIPSYQVKVDDVISLSDTGARIPYIAELLKADVQGIPGWLKRKQAVGTITRKPEREDIPEQINEQLIVEYYSK